MTYKVNSHYVFIAISNNCTDRVFIDSVEYLPQQNIGAIRSKLKQPDLEIIYSRDAWFEGSGYGVHNLGLYPEIVTMFDDEVGAINRTFSQYRSEDNFFLYEIDAVSAIKAIHDARGAPYVSSAFVGLVNDQDNKLKRLVKLGEELKKLAIKEIEKMEPQWLSFFTEAEKEIIDYIRANPLADVAPRPPDDAQWRNYLFGESAAQKDFESRCTFRRNQSEQFDNKIASVLDKAKHLKAKIDLPCSGGCGSILSYELFFHERLYGEWDIFKNVKVPKKEASVAGAGAYCGKCDGRQEISVPSMRCHIFTEKNRARWNNIWESRFDPSHFLTDIANCY